MRDQFVVTSMYKEDGVESSKVMLVTDDADVAQVYDVSLYNDPHWNVWLEHFVVDESNVVVGRRGTHILYPTNPSSRTDDDTEEEAQEA